jgi:Triose-phosphate Transporter family
MVLTRHQEQMLMRQYHVVSDKYPATPETPGEKILPNGQRLKSALKLQTRLRPWESESDSEGNDASPPNNIAGGKGSGDGLKKRVRIDSEGNMVHIFEKDQSQFTEDISNGRGENAVTSFQGQKEEEDDSPGYMNGGSIITGSRRNTRSRSNNNTASGSIDKKDKKSGTRKMSTSSSGISSSFTAILALLAWAVSSSWLIFLNRDIMRFKGFPCPLLLPALSQLACAIMAWGVGYAGIVSVRPFSLNEFGKRLSPLLFGSVMCMALGNTAYMGLSVAFLNILKALTPAVTLALSAAVGMESFTVGAFFSTLLIAYGTGIATMQETANNTAFHWPSFISFTTSILFESIRVVMAAKSLRGMKTPYNPVEMLAHVGPFVFLCMATLSVIAGETNDVVALGWNGAVGLIPDMVLVCILSFLVNVSSYYAIMHTSSTTFKVVGKFLGYRVDVLTVF